MQDDFGRVLPQTCADLYDNCRNERLRGVKSKIKVELLGGMLFSNLGGLVAI
jgi:hypothetical protein